MVYSASAIYIKRIILERINLPDIKNTINNIITISIHILFFMKLDNISLKFSLFIYYAFLILYGSNFLKSNIISTKPIIPKIIGDPIINKRTNKSILVPLGIPTFLIKK